MKLYSYYRSSAAYRVRIFLNLKKIQYDIEPVNLLKAEQTGDAYKQINRQGFVPTLETTQGLITQSNAIIDWINNSYPEPKLLPDDNFKAAQVKSFCNIITCDIHPLNNLRILKYLKNQLSIDDTAKNEWYRKWIVDGFSVLEPQMRSSDFCFGSSPSMADAYLIPQVYNAVRFDTDLSNFPNIQKTYNNCNELDAFLNAHPDHQADNPAQQQLI
jgi:maleylacetoacetate isomerase